MKEKKYLYIPIEVKKRELHAKAILAFYAALDGYQVILGQSTVLEKTCSYTPPGIFLGTSIVKQHRILFNKLKKYKYKIVSVDEEGLVYYNKKNFIKHRVDIKTLNMIDAFFTWGDHHYRLIESKQELENIHKVGNIRFELLKKKYLSLYSKEVTDIKNKYGKYILINTNLAAYNNFKSSNDYTQSLSSLVEFSQIDLGFYNDKIEHQKITFESFIILAQKLATLFPKHKIIIRPHPSEKIETYKKYENQNLRVVFKGTVIPWILASDCILQQNCTTAIEALCLNKPIMSYLPAYDERFDGGLPNKVVPSFTNSEEVIKCVKRVIEDPSQWDHIYKKYKHCDINDYISNMDENQNIFNSYLKLFDKLAFSNYKNFPIYRTRLFYNIEIAVLNIINKERRENIKYIKQKFNSLIENELYDILNFISKIDDQNFHKIQIENIVNNTFIISQVEEKE